MVHKDYSIQEPTTIRVYSDRLEIFCLGGLPTGWTPDKLLQEHTSIRRNRALASVFFTAGYVENWGQGIEKVLEECRSNGNPDPEFSIMNDSLKVVVRIKAIERPKVPQTDVFKIDEKSKAILSCIAEDPSVSAKRMAEIIGISDSTVERRLKELVTKGIIRREGSDKKGKWIIMQN